MNVTLYTFSKKHNSTAVPTGGTSVDVVLKDEAGVLDPIIELHTSASPSAYNYLYIPTFGRYYWLREWTYNRGIWTGSFYVDPLASWRTQIGAQHLYVFRSAAEWDGRLVDTYYPAIADPEITVIDLPNMWTTTQAASSGAARQSGIYVLGIISDETSLVKYYGFTGQGLETFMTALFSNSYYESIVGPGIAITPELKADINPCQYIVSCKYWPAGVGGFGSTSYMLGSAGVITPSPFKVGKGTVGLGGQVPIYTFSAGSVSYELTHFSQPIDISGITHPQQAARGIFLRGAPFTKWEVFIPPFGLIELDSNDLLEADSIKLTHYYDIRSGNGTLDIFATVSGTDKQIARATALCAIDTPISGIIQTGVGPASIISSIVDVSTALIGGFLNGGVGAGTGSLVGAAGIAAKAIGDFNRGKIPHLSMTGSVGSQALLSGGAKLIVTCQIVANDDLAGRGRPLCDKRTLSAIPGYIMADPDELSIAATARELEEIRGFISGGFFYE